MDATTISFADFATELRHEQINANALHTTKRVLVDAFACAVGGYESDPPKIGRRLAARRSCDTPARLIGMQQRTTPEAAAFANAVAIRYLTASDTYSGDAGSVHPSDMLGAIFAAADVTGACWHDVQTAIAIAYEIAGMMADRIYVRGLGWDQGIYLAPAAAAAAGRLLGLTRDQIGEAISIAATAYVATRQSREGALAMWKGCAGAATAQGGLWAALLAGEGMTGPVAAYEGPRGVWEQVTGEFDSTLPSKSGTFALERLSHKRFPAEFHSQGPLAVVLGVRERVPAEDLAEIRVQIYEMAYTEIGSGAEKWDPQTRETADHSLAYMLAMAFRDGDLTPASFTPECVRNPALRSLMAKVKITENPEFTARYPQELCSDIEVVTRSGDRYAQKINYPKGHCKDPLSDEELAAKLRAFSKDILRPERAAQILDTIWHLDPDEPMTRLFDLFECIEEDGTRKGIYLGRFES